MEALRRFQVFLTQWQDAKSLRGTETQASADEEDAADAVLENMNFVEFKERYRRLIPYMTYFVAKDYTNPQVMGRAQTQQDYGEEVMLPTSPLVKKQRLQPVARPDESSIEISNGRGVMNTIAGTVHKQKAEFVPSVQYDPKEPDGDADYFTPVRYETKLNYDTMQYGGSRVANQYREYGRLQQRPILPPEVTSSGTRILQQDNQYHLNDGQSSRPHADPHYERKYLPEKSNEQIADPHKDYVLDYRTRVESDKGPISDQDYGYSTDDGEPARDLNFKPASRHQHPKPTRILAQHAPRRPLPQLPSPSIYSTGNNPSARLEDIMKSLQLTDRLPEVLDKNNIDSSLKTLIEILGILNSPRPSDFPRTPVANGFSPQAGNVASYDRFKQIHTRPSKVVTETIFQATPRPRVPPQEQSLRYESEATYEMNNGRESVPAPNYKIVNNNKPENVVEYYRPLLQKTEDKNVAASHKPTVRPLQLEQWNENKYEIDKDFGDNTREDQMEETYVLPITTETPVRKFRVQNAPSTTNRPLETPVILEYGATRGKPSIDYPVHAVIPETQFSCKKQRYKGFFGDPSTGCQVWHYCDLNGGKSSFLCPNGTIFSQVALTCDWWFNVKCESTTQLYVLNERLYKYILPIMPKFPEDFSGPEVDRYLELKFKEMEAKLREKKLKKQQEREKVKDKLQSLDSEE